MFKIAKIIIHFHIRFYLLRKKLLSTKYNETKYSLKKNYFFI